MGLSRKSDNLNSEMSSEEIEKYYLLGLEEVIDFYKHERIVLIGHSFSAYLSLLYLVVQI